MNSIEQTISRMERMGANSRLLHKGMVFFLLCSLAFSFFVPGLISVSGSAAIVCLLLSGWQRKQAEELLAQSQTVEGLCSSMEDVKYLGRDVWTQDEFAEWNLLPIRRKGRNLLCQHGFSGYTGGQNVVGAEVTFHYEPTFRKGTYLFLNGTMLRSNGGIQTQNWLLLRKGELEDVTESTFCQEAGYHAEPTGYPELDEEYTLFRMPGSEKPNDAQLKRIAVLAHHSDHLGAVRVDVDSTTLFLSGKFYTTLVPSGRISAQMLTSNLLPERDLCLALFRSCGFYEQHREESE